MNLSRMILITSLSLMRLLFQFPVNAGSDGPIGPTNIAINPPLPHADDAVQIIVSGTWSNQCVPVYDSHQSAGQMIHISTTSPELETPGIACVTVITEWSFSLDMGVLLTGTTVTII